MTCPRIEFTPIGLRTAFAARRDTWRSAGVHAKTRHARQRGLWPPLNPVRFTVDHPRLSAFPVYSLDLMALRIHITVPVRMPARRDRKSRLRLLDSNNEEFEKGGGLAPDLGGGSKLTID